MIFDVSLQPGQMHLLYAREAVDSSDRFSSDVSAANFVPSKITCLQIIQEDYEGLRLSYPSKVFVDFVKNEIYVNDSGNNTILVYTHDFYPLLSISKSDGVEVPVGVAVDPKGYVFITQAPTKQKKGRISVLDPCLKWKKDIFFQGFEGADDFQPTNIAINDKGHFYVTASSYTGVVVLDKDGTFSHLLTPTDSLGKAPVQKAKIHDVEIDSQGNIYLLSEDMGRIYVYDSQERFLFKFGEKGGSTGKLSRPRGVAVDSRNKRIYVIDYMRHTASAYSTDGRFLFEFGGKGWGRGWFQYPTDIAVDALGNVLVADTFNNRVQVLSIQGGPPVTVAKVEEAKPEAPVTEHLVEEAKLKVPVKERLVAEAKPSPPVKEETIKEEIVEEVKPKAPVKKELAEPKPAKYYVLTANMNLREKSTTKSRIIQLLKKGEEFHILDQYKHDDFNSWFLVKTRSGLTGWFCGIYSGKDMFVEKERKRIPAVAKAEKAEPKVPVKKKLVEEVKPKALVIKKLIKPKPAKYYVLTADMQDVATLKLKVLSGDGDLNSAKRMAKKLGNMGYKIKLVDRAPRSNFLRNTVYFASGFQDEAKRLVSSLGNNTILKPLTWSSKFDIIVVTGKK